MITLLTLALTLSTGAQQQTQIRAALDREDDAAAESMLRSLAQSSPESFTRNNYDYLLARLLERRGATAEAAQLYQKVWTRSSLLAPYALWHQAELARAARNPSEEQRLLQQLIAQHPSYLRRERAVQRLADSFYKSGQYQNVMTTLRLLGGPRRDALSSLGEAQLGLRQIDAARASFETVLTSGLSDDASLHAALGLDRIESGAAMQPTEAERLRRARIYQFNRYFAEARRHWLALSQFSPNHPRRAEILFQLGRGYFLENNFAEAIKWYERVHDEFPRADEGEQGFYYVGHCYQFLDDASRATQRYEAYLREYPEGSFIGYAHLNAIDTLRSAGRFEDALQWARRAQSLTGDPFIAVSGLFQQAKIRLTQNDYAGALADFTALRTRNLSARGLMAGTNAPEAAFMRAYCLEKLGRLEEAVSEYLALPEVRSGAAGYYGWRASERLHALANDAHANGLITARLNTFKAEAQNANPMLAKAAANQALRLSRDPQARGEMLSVLRTAYARLPGYQIPNFAVGAAGRASETASSGLGAGRQAIAGELLFLGLADEGAAELLAGSSLNATTAFYCARGECAHRTLDFAEPTLKRLPEDFRLELLPRQTAEMFYPFPYRDALYHQAAARSVDPRFVLSIIRQESTYDPRVKSGAAARGMMQFIASTANQIATQLQLNDFSQNDLYDADTAVLFGSQYIKNLNDEFGSGQAVAAAYNGSEESVRRWKGRARSNEVDRLVIEVAKRESKDYVFKVMNNFNAYRAIYTR